VLLTAVFGLAMLGVGAIQIWGRRMGQPCADSYSCRGFLIGGAECVDVGPASYCTVYCRTDERCPKGWHCLPANPTVLTARTSYLDKVCVRDP
jgi:hypothetical protein